MRVITDFNENRLLFMSDLFKFWNIIVEIKKEMVVITRFWNTFNFEPVCWAVCISINECVDGL